MFFGNRFLKPWQGYLFALGATSATLAARLALDGPLGGRPTVVTFTLPIILSAYLFGMRAGLLATAWSGFATSYYLLPDHALLAASGIELLLYSRFPLAGVVISALGNRLHRARRDATIAAGEQRWARMALAESDGRYRALVDWAPDAIVVLRDGRILFVNRAAITMFDATSAQDLVGKPILDLVHPDFHESVLEHMRMHAAGGVMPHSVERRFITLAGAAIDVEVRGTSIVYDGQPAILRSIRDITERKKAEAALHQLSARLLRLEDEERRRLARELHDSTAQRLAALCMNLSVANEAAGALDARTQHAMEESAVLANECLREIRTVAYLLHPSEVDHVGLQSALSRYIDGFVQRSGITVETDVAADLGRLPEAVETTVFRIVQECLMNIHRHSGSHTARIRLRRSRADLVLEVHDAGTGVRGDAPPGVGILSMQERLEPFGGSLEISSRPDGTKVKAVVPLVRGVA